MNFAKVLTVGFLMVLLALFGSMMMTEAAEENEEKIRNDFHSRLISQANQQIVSIVKQFRADIQRAISFEKMLTLAQAAEKAIFSVIDALEEMMGPIQFNPFYITVCNRRVADCVVFDPPNLIG